MIPSISKASIGIDAISPIIPKAIYPEPTTMAKPEDRGRRKVEVMGPVATPPLSKAIEANRVGTKGRSIRIIP